VTISASGVSGLSWNLYKYLVANGVTISGSR
jgi:hypothetical protein